jgi:hypothetical protein
MSKKSQIIDERSLKDIILNVEEKVQAQNQLEEARKSYAEASEVAKLSEEEFLKSIEQVKRNAADFNLKMVRKSAAAETLGRWCSLLMDGGFCELTLSLSTLNY